MRLKVGSTEWWRYQAELVGGNECPKCRAETEGVFVIDAAEAGNYANWICRAVIERCRICGWSWTAWWQENEKEIVQNLESRLVKKIGVPGVKNRRLDFVGRRESEGTRVKLPGAKLKRKRMADPIRYHPITTTHKKGKF